MSGPGRLLALAGGAVLRLPVPPGGGPAEALLEAAGLGRWVVQAPSGPAGCTAAWTPPAGAGPLRLLAWNLDTGEALDGSPLDLPPGAAGQAPLAARPLAGLLPAGAPHPLAPDAWAEADAGARCLHHLWLAPGEGGQEGWRLLAGQAPARVSLHLRQGPAMPARLRAWLPAAPAGGAPPFLEVWLSRREGGRFVPLRLLRRVRLPRRPCDIGLEMPPDAAGEDAWISISALDAPGLCLRRPGPAPAPPPAGPFEDARLSAGFAGLRALARMHGGPDAAAGLLPPAPHPTPAEAKAPPFTRILVPVRDGGAVVQACLASLRRSSAAIPFEVVVLDDASREDTAFRLRAAVAADPRLRLHRRDDGRGYTRTVNEGLALEGAPWVVVMNSDTLAPAGWLDRLHDAIRARPGAGMAGPLSNAASWQGVPEARRPDGSWSTNDAITPARLDEVQALLDRLSERARPEFPLLNGFCTLIARAVLDRTGPLDEEAFPMGYGEETDLCLRARAAGFRLVLADDAFVFHHKGASFGAARRARLSRQGNREVAGLHPGAGIAAMERAMQACPVLARLRPRLAAALAGGGA